MKPPFVPDRDKPYRAPKSLRELKRRRKQRQDGSNYTSLFDRLFYAVLTALMYGFGGFLLDATVTVIRSIMDMGDGSIFWLFMPFLTVLGAIIGFFSGKSAGADSMDMFNHTDDPHLDDYSIRHDIFRGIGYGILFCFVVWLVMLLVV